MNAQQEKLIADARRKFVEAQRAARELNVLLEDDSVTLTGETWTVIRDLQARLEELDD